MCGRRRAAALVAWLAAASVSGGGSARSGDAAAEARERAGGSTRSGVVAAVEQGVLALASQDMDSAESHFRKALALDPASVEVRIVLGNLLYMRRGRRSTRAIDELCTSLARISNILVVSVRPTGDPVDAAAPFQNYPGPKTSF